MRVCGGEGVMEMEGEGGVLDGSHSSHLLPHMFTPPFPCFGDLVGTHILADIYDALGGSSGRQLKRTWKMKKTSFSGGFSTNPCQ